MAGAMAGDVTRQGAEDRAAAPGVHRRAGAGLCKHRKKSVETLRRSYMPTYILLSNLTDDGAKALKAKPKRLQEVNKEIERFGAKVTAQYAVLGPYDFVSIVECPDNETITRVSVELSSRGSVRLLTLPAMPVANFVRNLKS